MASYICGPSSSSAMVCLQTQNNTFRHSASELFRLLMLLQVNLNTVSCAWELGSVSGVLVEAEGASGLLVSRLQVGL